MAKPANSLCRYPLPTPRSRRPCDKKIERRNLLGEQDRIVPGEHKDRGAQPQPRRASRDEGKKRQGRRKLADPGEVMLGQEARMETERLGFDVGIETSWKPCRARRERMRELDRNGTAQKRKRPETKTPGAAEPSRRKSSL